MPERDDRGGQHPLDRISLALSIRQERRLVFEIATRKRRTRRAHFYLSLGPFRQVVKDYFPNLRKLL